MYDIGSGKWTLIQKIPQLWVVLNSSLMMCSSFRVISTCMILVLVNGL